MGKCALGVCSADLLLPQAGLKAQVEEDGSRRVKDLGIGFLNLNHFQNWLIPHSQNKTDTLLGFACGTCVCAPSANNLEGRMETN